MEYNYCRRFNAGQRLLEDAAGALGLRAGLFAIGRIHRRREVDVVLLALRNAVIVPGLVRMPLAALQAFIMVIGGGIAAAENPVQAGDRQDEQTPAAMPTRFGWSSTYFLKPSLGRR